ncbi:hypothetical protein BC835DRAFT_1416907 [Cytidiella melzeri]|nr:hypothetical protein BC835DRAFT_1416907 [Cytidiella melzeri]
MAKTKKKAQVAEASEDDHSDAGNPQAPHATGTTRSGVTSATTSHTTRQVRKKSAKQTSLDYEDLLKRAAKLERENKALKRSKAKEPGMRANVQVGAAATIQPANDDKSDAEDTMVRQDNDGNNDSPEEEDNDIIIYKSPFQSKGTVEATKKLSRRVNNSKAVTPVDMNEERLPAVPAVRAQDTSRSSSPLSQLSSRSHACQHSCRSSQASDCMYIDDSLPPLSRSPSRLRSQHSRCSSQASDHMYIDDSLPPLSRSPSRLRSPSQPPLHLTITLPDRASSPVDDRDYDVFYGARDTRDHRNQGSHDSRTRDILPQEAAPSSEPQCRGRARSSIDGQAQHQHKRPQNTSPSSMHPPHSDIEYKGGIQPVLAHRPKEGDYLGATAKIISRSILQYELKLLTEAAFPELDTQNAWAREALRAACQEYQRAYSHDSEEVARINCLIINCASNFRGRIRDKICSRIVETYGPNQDLTDDVSVQTNADRVRRLLEPVGQSGDANCYCYKKHKKNPPCKMVELPIIMHALQEVIAFCPKGSTTGVPPGVEFCSLLDPLPIPTIALLLTTVRYRLHHWSTGRIAHKEFREATYKEVFDKHVRHLKDWQDFNQVVTTKIRGAMYRTVICLGGHDLVDEAGGRTFNYGQGECIGGP